MIKYILYLITILLMPVLLQAQYLGGNGRGDISLRTVVTQAQYFGGNGRGDVSLRSLNNILTNENSNDITIPTTFSLQQNSPNPFNPTTNISFDIAKLSNVKIVVYDVIGREVKILVNESLQPGNYEASFDGNTLNSGVYFYKLISDDFTETKRMLLIK